MVAAGYKGLGFLVASCMLVVYEFIHMLSFSLSISVSVSLNLLCNLSTSHTLKLHILSSAHTVGLKLTLQFKVFLNSSYLNGIVCYC